MRNINTFRDHSIASEHAIVAKRIKTELAEKFPGINFSIKSKSFASGDNVTVAWTDGPSKDAIESLVLKYRYGTFDVSRNLYMRDNYNDNLPQAKYVMLSHHYSDLLCKKAKEEIALGFNVDMNDNQAVFATFGNWPQPLIRAKLEHTYPFK